MRQFASVLQQHPDARAGGACPAGGREGHRACTETARRATWRSGATNGWLSRTSPAPWSSTRRGCASRPAMPAFSGRRRLPSRASDAGMRRWSTSGRRSASIPGRSAVCGRLATRFSVCGATPRREKLSTVVSPSRPPTSTLIEYKAMTFLGEGDLAGCPGRAQGRAEGGRAHRARGLPGELPGSRLGPRRGAARASAAADAERIRRRPGHLGHLPRSGLRLEGRRRERAHLRRGGEEGVRGAASRSARRCAAPRRSRPRAGVPRSERGSDPGGRARRRARSRVEGRPGRPLHTSTSSCGSTCSSASRRRRSTSSSRC